MKIKCMNDLLRNLVNYKFYYYEWIMLNASIQSPKFSDMPKSLVYPDQLKKLNSDIIRKKELEDKMTYIESLVDTLRSSDNYMLFPVIYYKFLKFKDMKEIAIMYHYDERQIYRIYKKAKEELLKNVSKCQ